MGKKRHSEKLTDQLRGFVRRADKTLGQMARETGIDKSALSRFANGERGLSMEALDTLGDYFRLRLTTATRPTKAKER